MINFDALKEMNEKIARESTKLKEEFDFLKMQFEDLKGCLLVDNQGAPWAHKSMTITNGGVIVYIRFAVYHLHRDTGYSVWNQHIDFDSVMGYFPIDTDLDTMKKVADIYENQGRVLDSMRSRQQPPSDKFNFYLKPLQAEFGQFYRIRDIPT